MEIKAVRGMHDLFGEEMDRWHFVENRVKKSLEAFGYGEIRTPVLEKKEVFSQTVGEDTDIVEKQMYQVGGDASEKLVLRPEGTAAFIRAVIEHQLHRTGKAQRFYYYLPMFRHERPQKGRLRQFHQFGAELINDPTPEADAEIIAVLDHLYKSFEITEYEIRINSVGCTNCRPLYKEKLTEYFRPRLAELCPQCQTRFERAPMRILDCKNEACQKIAEGAPKILQNLDADCSKHHETLKKRLKSLSIPFIEDPNIVRGLDYYIRTAFEFTSNLLGAQSALVGGGRYDGLSTRFGEDPFPAVGFGMGVERLMIALEEKKSLQNISRAPIFYFAPLGEAAFEKLYPIAHSLRTKGVWVDLNHEPKNLKAHLKHADRVNCCFALILGDDEINQGKAMLKDMKAGTQETLSLATLEADLLRRS